MPFDISVVQVLLVLLVVLLVFGPRRLPELGRGLGRGLRDFRTGLRGTDLDVDPTPATPRDDVQIDP
jgi:sec-independent protein translocase protein TatA